VDMGLLDRSIFDQLGRWYNKALQVRKAVAR
jgi:hypothetical protein